MPSQVHTTDSYLSPSPRSHDTDSLLYTYVEQVHTTDSLLKGTSTKIHATDSLLYFIGEPLHTTDSVLLGESQLIHSSDSLLRGKLREPLLGNEVTRTIPPGDNSGFYDVSLLGMNGNSKFDQQLKYSEPDQELSVGKSPTVEIFVVDDIIKR